MKKLTIIGVILSIIWTIFFAALLYFKHEQIQTLKLNEWGDFFAGAVAPLAFFWLVLGYLQQGEELRLNTEALHAQQEELRRQVIETAILAANAERQASATEQLAHATKSEAQRAALKEAAESMPVFSPNGGNGGSNTQTELNIVNSGATVKKLTVINSAGINIRIFPSDLFQRKMHGTLTIPAGVVYPFNCSIQFLGLNNKEQCLAYEMISQFVFIEAPSSIALPVV